MSTVIAFTRYYIALLFGVALAADFSGMARTRKNVLALLGFTVLLFAVQLVCEQLWGLDAAIKLYPLIAHLPVVFWLALFFKKSWLLSVSSMLLSFLCCQPPRWIGAVTGELFDSAAMDHIAYIVVAFVLLFLLRRYVAASVRHLMERSVKTCLLFCTLPAALYYLYDFAANVYTDFITSGNRAVVQFMPFVLSTLYFVILLFYYAETQKQAEVQRERDMLNTQLKQAQTELSALREMQQISASYRHDLRHHVTFLQGLALSERIEDIREYLRTVQSDIDAFTPTRFCEHETVNLILSSFAAKAKQSGIALAIDATLPETLPLSDTEICSLLSNALENAIHAAQSVPDNQNRHIKLRMYPKNNKLCADIRNTFQKEPLFHQGLPVAKEQGHGYGTRSMVHIVQKHGGVYQFLVKDGWFVFQASI